MSLGDVIVIWLQRYNESMTRDHHRAAIRVLTFEVMERECLVVHTCVHRDFSGEHDKAPSPEYAEEMESEDPEIIDLFEGLVSEFTDTLLGSCDGGIPDESAACGFWGDTWPKRMEEALDAILSDKMSDGDIRAAEEVGVAWVEELEDESGESDDDEPEPGQELLWFRRKIEEI